METFRKGFIYLLRDLNQHASCSHGTLYQNSKITLTFSSGMGSWRAKRARQSIRYFKILSFENISR